MSELTTIRDIRLMGQRGFTLLELLVTVAVAAIFLAIAVPSLSTFIQNSRETSEADSLISSLEYARSEAVKRDSEVEVCAASSGACTNSTAWNTGWIVATTGASPTVLQSMPGLGGNNTLSGAFNGTAVTQVTFEPSGFVAAAAGSGVYHTTYFTLCDPRGAAYARDVEVTAIGAVESSSTPGESLQTPPQALTCP